MLSSSFRAFDCLLADLANGKHNLGAHVLKAMLSNVAPSSGWTVRADVTELVAGDGYTTGGNPCTLISSSQIVGVYDLILQDPGVWTAGPGPMGPFRYVVLYNSTAVGGPLIGWWDCGVHVTVAIGKKFTGTFGGAAALEGWVT